MFGLGRGSGGEIWILGDEAWVLGGVMGGSMFGRKSGGVGLGRTPWGI